MTATTTSIGRDTVEQLLAMRAEWHTKDHPFYVDFFEGKFGLGPMAAMMAQHYQHTRRGLPLLGVAYSKGSPDDRRYILENLVEEEGMRAGPGEDRHAVDHSETILRFCRAAGLPDDKVKSTVQLPSWQARTYYFINVFRDEPFGVIMAMQSSMEGQQPAINSERTLPALEKYHGYRRDDPTIEFFAEHELADADHASRSLDLVAKLITSDELRIRALEVATVALRTRWACMNEIYRVAVLGQLDPQPKGVRVSS